MVKINLLTITSKPWTSLECYRDYGCRSFSQIASSFCFDLLAKKIEKIPTNFLSKKEALIIGMGYNIDEANLILQRFKDLERIHIVEWDRSKIKFLKKYFNKNQKVKVYFADAQNLSFIADGKIKLVYFSGVLDLHNYGCRCDLKIIREIYRVLAEDGLAVSLDLSLYASPKYPIGLYDRETIGNILKK